MSTTHMIVMALFLWLSGSVVATCQSSPADSLAESQIRANVPAGRDFDRFLKRDLAAYFQNSKGKVVVEYELLRKAPTQTGIAYPKFYAWVEVKKNGTLLEEGAVRVAAMEKKHFEVTDYLSAADIERVPQRVYRVFPADVAEKIIRRVGKQPFPSQTASSWLTSN